MSSTTWRSARRSGCGAGRYAILVLLVVITAVASSLLDNVTTVLLVAPVTIQITRRLGIPPVPFLIAEALASNIGGTATLVGDPPNIIVASRAGLSYGDFLVHLAPLVIVLLLGFLALSRVMMRSALVENPDRVAELMRLDPAASLTDRGLLVRGLAVLALVTAAFVAHSVTHLEPAAVALVGAGVLLVIARRDPNQFLAHVEWATLAFFVGLFVMVGALVKTGAVDRVAERLADATSGHVPRAMFLLLAASAVLSAIVDNIPYVATMAPVVSTLIADLHSGHDPNVLWWALDARRRPGRQRHHHRGQRQRGDRRRRRAGGIQDPLRRVREIRHPGDGHDDRAVGGVPLGALHRSRGHSLSRPGPS